MDLARRYIRKLRFLRRIAASRVTRRDRLCPYCASDCSDLLARKYFMLDLRQCSRCRLMFRWPKDSAHHNYTYYQDDYCEGVATQVPDEVLLRQLKGSLFRDTAQDFSDKLSLLKDLVPAGRILDFGCSWGYSSYQLAIAGYETIGFEISRPRAEFARARLGVKSIYEPDKLARYMGSFDAIFASHVLEHLPSLNDTFDLFRKLLKPSGVLLAFVPNCGGTKAREFGVNWGPMCCEKHTTALHLEFFQRNLPHHGFESISFSDPYPQHLRIPISIAQLAGLRCDGDELVVCAWPRANGTSSTNKLSQFLRESTKWQ
jgi:2-polyprenyl-3-methyl-5-hydroxy-6-metoxy-1,4-benzoquinol methylase